MKSYTSQEALARYEQRADIYDLLIQSEKDPNQKRDLKKAREKLNGPIIFLKRIARRGRREKAAYDFLKQDKTHLRPGSPPTMGQNWIL